MHSFELKFIQKNITGKAPVPRNNFQHGWTSSKKKKKSLLIASSANWVNDANQW